jgi:hypothetical protein
VVPVQVADGERLVDLELLRRGQLAVAHLTGRDVHIGVARDRHDLGPLPVGRDVDDHQRVRLVGDQAAAVRLAQPLPRVGAEDHDVLRLRVQVHRLIAEQAADVVLLYVRVEVLEQHVAAASDRDEQEGEARRAPDDDLPARPVP